MIKQIYRFLNPKFQNLFLDYKVDFKPRYGHGQPAHPELLNIIERQRGEYKLWLERMMKYQDQFHQIVDAKLEKDAKMPSWNNGFLPGLDIIALYTLMAEVKPKRYVEVGSGNSTKVAYKAKQDLQLASQIISIDPMPRAEIDILADKIIREPFENVKTDIVDSLEENDILFIDNSHRILPNSDAMVFFMEVLPRLKKGVIVQIHDVYLPYDYPQFMCDRYYSEQYGLAMYLLANPEKYQAILPNYFVSEDLELSAKISTIWEHDNLKGVEKHGGSFWIRINQ